MDSYLTSVLLAALRADDVRVLVAEVHVLDVPLQAHLVEILVGRNLKVVSVYILGWQLVLKVTMLCKMSS